MLRRRHADRSEATIIFAPASGRLKVLMPNHCLTEQNVLLQKKIACQVDVPDPEQIGRLWDATGTI